MLTRSTRVIHPAAALLLGLALAGGCEENSRAPSTDHDAGNPAPATNGTGQTPGDANRSTTNRGTNPPPATNPTPATNPPGDRAAAASEQEVLAYLAALDQGEINIGQAALGRELPPALREYAQMLVDDHTQHARLTQQTGARLSTEPSRTADVAAFSDGLAKALAELEALEDDQAFASQFVDKMIAGHREAIDLLDTRLLPAAHSPALRDFLNQTRTTLQQHLDRARALKNP